MMYLDLDSGIHKFWGSLQNVQKFFKLKPHVRVVEDA